MNLPTGDFIAVVPVILGPLQVLLAILPALLLATLAALLSLFRPAVMKSLLLLLWRLKIQLAVILLCGGALAWGVRSIWPPVKTEIGGLEAGSRDWSLFRGGPERRGALPGAPDPAAGGINWVWRQRNEAFFSTPAVVGNRIYVASASIGPFSQKGAIYCFDADSGAPVWTSAPKGYRPTFSSPVVSGNYLVCGEGLHYTSDARVICLDLRPGREGRVLWTYGTGSHVECTPVVDGGRVFIGAGDDGYYCFELEPGPDGEARVVWHAPGKLFPDSETALAVHDGRVYAGLGVGGEALCILDAATGRELKRIKTPHPVFGPPAISRGKLYVGMGTGDYVHRAEEIGLRPAGEVWCLDLKTLEVEWKYRAGHTVLGAVAVAGDEMYFCSREGKLHGLDRRGKPVGIWDAHAPIIASPAVTDRHIYLITVSGMLYAIDRRRFEPVWELTVSASPRCLSSPVVARGRVYVGTQVDGFLCAGKPAEERAIPVWAGHLGGPGAGGNLDGSPLPELGAFHWQYPDDQTGETREAIVAAPVAVLEESLIVPLCGGPGKGLACLRIRSGTGEAPAPLWIYPTQNGVHLSPAISDKLVLAVDGRTGDEGRNLHGVNRPGGEGRWKRPVAAGATGVFLSTEEEVFIQDRPGALSSLDLQGVERWSRPAGILRHAPCPAGSLIIAATVDPATLMALDRPTGRELWRIPLSSPPTTSPVFQKSAILLGTAAGLEARSPLDGATLPGWTDGSGGVSGEMAMGRNVIAFTSSRGELTILSRTSGKVLRRVPGALPGMAPLLGRRWVLYLTGEGISRCDPEDPGNQPVQWVDTSWLGRPASPMVLKDSGIYLGMAGWGLVRLGGSR